MLKKNLLEAIFCSCLATAICISGSTAWGENSLRTIGQNYNSVRLASWNQDGEVIFNGGRNENLSVRENEILRYGVGSHSRTGQGLLLVDGSLLIGRIIQVDSSQCEIVGQYFRTFIPRPLVRSILVHAPGLEGVSEHDNIEQEWLGIARNSSGADDLIQTVNGDWITGTIENDGTNKVFVAGTTDQLSVRKGSSTRQISWQQIRGIIFSPLLTGPMNPPAGAVTVGLSDGTRLITTKVSGQNKGVWTFELACGIELFSRNDQLSADQISYIGKTEITSQTDLKIKPLDDYLLRMRHTPLFGEFSDIQAIQGGAGEGSLRVRDGWLEHCLRLKAGTQAVFRVPAEAKRLTTELLIERGSLPVASSTASVQPVRCAIATVRKGGEVKEVWRSQTLDASQSIAAVEIQLEQAVAVILIIERTAALEPSGNAIWINPVLHF